MKFRPSQQSKKDKLITIEEFKGGFSNLIDEARMDKKFAKESNNLMQVSDGLWKTRWGTQEYGATHDASIDGAYEYVKSDGSTELITIADGKGWKSTDGGSLTEITGATFTAGVKCYFMQIGATDKTDNTKKSYLYIANGTDSLTRYNGTALETYTQIDPPTNLTASLVASGLSSGTYTYYGEVTALNAVGETVGSDEVSITVNKDRDSWTADTDKGIYWGWGAVSGATRYQLYIADEQGAEKRLTSTTATSFIDDGTETINPYILTPIANTTGGPKFKSMCVSGNRVWATSNDDDMYAVYWSGTDVSMGTFSDFYGGGVIYLEEGGREIPVSVVHYQTGQGTGRLTTLCKTPDGQGAIWQISIDSVTVGDTPFSIPTAVKIVGSSGTESISGVVATNRDIGFPNRRGWYFLGPEKQYYGILITREESSLIRPFWRSLSQSNIDDIASYFYDAKIFISVATSSDTGNDKTLVFDTERGGNWGGPWSFGAKQFLEYTDTGGTSHFLYVPVDGTKLVEISDNVLGDKGVAFNQSYISPLLSVSDKETDMLTHIESTVRIGSPTGTVNFEVLGIGKDSAFSTIGAKTIQNLGSSTGFGSDKFSDSFYTSTQDNSKNTGSWVVYFTDSPETFTQATVKRTIKKRAQLYAIQYHIYADTVDSSFTLQRLQTRGRTVSRRAPSSWTS